jgi:hypothetical protein
LNLIYKKLTKESRKGSEEMLIEVKGKEEALKDLEKAMKLIREAEKILYRIPSNLGLELTSDTGKELATDSAPNSQ